MYKLIIKPFAESDAEKSAIWYHNVRDGLGNEFLMALQVKLNAIQRDPDLFPVIYLTFASSAYPACNRVV
jgi:toxin ParE1/3/4